MYTRYSDKWWEQEVSCNICHGVGARSDMVDINDRQGIYFTRVHNNDDCIRAALNTLTHHARPNYGEYLEKPTEAEIEADNERDGASFIDYQEDGWDYEEDGWDYEDDGWDC